MFGLYLGLTRLDFFTTRFILALMKQEQKREYLWQKLNIVNPSSGNFRDPDPIGSAIEFEETLIKSKDPKNTSPQTDKQA
jgi:hypothetical protein